MPLTLHLQDIAPRLKALTRGLVQGGLWLAVAAHGQEYRLTDNLMKVPDATVMQMLQDMVKDVQARNPALLQADPPQVGPALDDGLTSQASPTLIMADNLRSVATPQTHDTATPAPQLHPKEPTPIPTPASPAASVSEPAAAAETLVLQPKPPTVTEAAKLSASGGRDGLPPLGIGDQITIAVFGQPDLSAEVTVGESGTIMVPLIGTLNVLNLSAAQLESMVATRLKDGGYLQNPGVSIQIRQLRSQQVSVIGEVQRPGRYPIQGRMTVLEALATAGGLTPRADKTIVLLRKPGADKGSDGQREEISIQLETDGGRFRGRLDATLLNDDVVFVGVQKLFYIHGEVRRPGAYPMEQGLNIMKALSISGGVSERGSERRIKVHRLNADKVLEELPAHPAMPLQADDVIHVDERLF